MQSDVGALTSFLKNPSGTPLVAMKKVPDFLVSSFRAMDTLPKVPPTSAVAPWSFTISLKRPTATWGFGPIVPENAFQFHLLAADGNSAGLVDLLDGHLGAFHLADADDRTRSRRGKHDADLQRVGRCCRACKSADSQQQSCQHHWFQSVSFHGCLLKWWMMVVFNQAVDVQHRIAVLQSTEFTHQRDDIALDAHQFKGFLYFDFVQVFSRSDRYLKSRLGSHENDFFQTPDAGEDNRPFHPWSWTV